MSEWELAYTAYEPGQEPLREALCTLGNGYFASRAAAPEAQDDGTHYPGTYVAGLYNRLCTEIQGHSVENEDLVNMPDWRRLRFRIGDGDWFSPQEVERLEYRQTLNIKTACVERLCRFEDADGRRTRLTQRWLVSLAEPHLAALQTRIEAENWSGPVEIASAIDGRIINNGVARYRDLSSRHLMPLQARALDRETLLLEVQTNQSHIRIAAATRTRLANASGTLSPEPETHLESGFIEHRYRARLRQGDTLRVEKTLALYTSQDRPISEVCLEARKTVTAAADFDSMLETHAQHWSHLWQHFDFRIHYAVAAEQERISRILRLHILHLLQTTSPVVMDLDVGVPARGLHGEAYRGHIFWDELFVFPLFNLRMPEITRALLRYRYRRLPEARRAAQSIGCKGAMFPWQSGSNGREESQYLHLNPKSGRWIPDNSYRQRHVNAAIAYNTWQYFQATDDLEFMAWFGAEMILEIARFWASLARYDAGLDRYEILGIMGPDEYHDAYPGADSPGLNNNAYTNVMAAWVLSRALELAEVLPARRFEELCEILDLDRAELDKWQTISRRLRVVFHDDGIISQFEGYEQLEEFDWQGYAERYGDIQRLDRILEAEDDTPNRYKVSKQADVLMLFYLFSAEELREIFERLDYPFEHDTIPRNIDYYMQRTSHGSTLSRVVHSWVLARANRSGAWQHFTKALESDVADIQSGTTPEGIHTGAMAGTVDLLQRCFTGIEMRNGILWLNPALPRGLHSLSLDLQYRQHVLGLEFSEYGIRIRVDPSLRDHIRVGIRGEVHTLAPGEIRDFPVSSEGREH